MTSTEEHGQGWKDHLQHLVILPQAGFTLIEPITVLVAAIAVPNHRVAIIQSKELKENPFRCATDRPLPDRLSTLETLVEWLPAPAAEGPDHADWTPVFQSPTDRPGDTPGVYDVKSLLGDSFALGARRTTNAGDGDWDSPARWLEKDPNNIGWARSRRAAVQPAALRLGAQGAAANHSPEGGRVLATARPRTTSSWRAIARARPNEAERPSDAGACRPRRAAGLCRRRAAPCHHDEVREREPAEPRQDRRERAARFRQARRHGHLRASRSEALDRVTFVNRMFYKVLTRTRLSSLSRAEGVRRAPANLLRPER